MPPMMLMFLTLLQATIATNPPVVDAPWGRIQGKEVPGDGKRKMNGYLGIPYARPPVGDLRFERPQPSPGPGKGETFVADTVAAACFQHPPILIGKERTQSEDCLILDIYTPITPPTAPRPVMFFIHGGGFQSGDSSLYKPSKLVVDGDLVVVVIQYRLGAFGFLNSGDSVLPPNLGLWDQTLALQWVHDNIAAFGGDPDTVTLFGESAGSMSVGLHTVSPNSKGLFKRAILQSGAPIGFALTKISPDVFVNLSKTLDCEGDDTQQRMECLKKVPGPDLSVKVAEFAAKHPLGFIAIPVIDGDYIPASPKVILQDDELLAQTSLQTIETIIGLNNQEGALVLMVQKIGNMTDDELRSPEVFAQMSMMLLMMNGFSSNEITTKALQFSYLGAEAGGKTVDIQKLADLYGDGILSAAILDWIVLLAASPKTGPRYMYVLEHDFEFNLPTLLHGSHHADDLALLFDLEQTTPSDSIFARFNKTGIAEHEKPLSKTFTQLFISFARTGKPQMTPPDDVEWPLFTSEKQQFLSISDTPKIVDNLGRYKKRWALWNKYLPELNSAVQKLQGQGARQVADEKKDEL